MKKTIYISITLIFALFLGYYGVIYYSAMKTIGNLEQIKDSSSISVNKIIYKSSIFEHKAVLYGVKLKGQLGAEYSTEPKDKTVVKMNLLSRKFSIELPGNSSFTLYPFMPGYPQTTVDYIGDPSVMEAKIGDMWNIIKWNDLSFIASIKYLKHHLNNTKIRITKIDRSVNSDKKAKEQNVEEYYVSKSSNIVRFHDYHYTRFPSSKRELDEIKAAGINGLYLPYYFDIISDVVVNPSAKQESKDFTQNLNLIFDLRGFYDQTSKNYVYVKDYKLNNYSNIDVNLQGYLSYKYLTSGIMEINNEILLKANLDFDKQDLPVEADKETYPEEAKYYMNFLQSLLNDGYFDGNIKFSTKSQTKLSAQDMLPMKVHLDDFNIKGSDNTFYINGTYNTNPALKINGEFYLSNFNGLYNDIYDKLMSSAKGLNSKNLELYNIIAKNGFRDDLLYTIKSISNYPDSSSPDLAIDIDVDQSKDKYKIGSQDAFGVVNSFNSLIQKYNLIGSQEGPPRGRGMHGTRP